jgi:hypothetical protein
MAEALPPRHLLLRNLPFAARLTLAVFLCSVGIGYASALVQLHFQHAAPGQALPTGDDAVKVFSGDRGPRPRSRIETLVDADEHLPWNGHGQMAAAFFAKSADWKSAIKARAKALAGRGRDTPDMAQGEGQLRKERETERQALLEWIRAGASKADYQQDRFCLPDSMADRPLADAFVVKEGDDKPAEPRAVKIRTVITQRCARCHTTGDSEDASAAQYPLDSYEHLKPYVTVQQSSGMSLTKLAQTTHVHLLGFSVLYGMTGLILAFSSYPRVLRVLVAPLPLAAQVVDISFWWLARLDDPYGPMFARAIVVSGAVVAVGLGLHIVLGLFDLFGRLGKAVLVLLLAAAVGGAYFAHEMVIAPYLAQEGQPANGSAKE